MIVCVLVVSWSKDLPDVVAEWLSSVRMDTMTASPFSSTLEHCITDWHSWMFPVSIVFAADPKAEHYGNKSHRVGVFGM